MADEIVQRVGFEWNGGSAMSANLSSSARSAREIAERMRESMRISDASGAGTGGIGGAMKKRWDENTKAAQESINTVNSKLREQLKIMLSLSRQQSAEEQAIHQKRMDYQFRYEAKLDRVTKYRLEDRKIVEANEEAKVARRSHYANVAAGAGAGAMAFGMGAAGMANPFAMERFTQATRDLIAVMGRTLVPTLNRMTDGVRMAADTFNELPSEAKSLFAGGLTGIALGGLSAGALNRFSRLGSAQGGRISAGIAGAGKYALPIGGAVAAAAMAHEMAPETTSAIAGDIGRTAKSFLNIGRRMFGLIDEKELQRRDQLHGAESRIAWGGGNDPATRAALLNTLSRRGASSNNLAEQYGGIPIGPSSSFGAARRQASYSDPIAFIQKLRSDAFMYSTPPDGGGSPTEKTNSLLQDILGAIEKSVFYQGTIGTVTEGTEVAYGRAKKLLGRGTQGKGGPQ